MPKTTTTQKPHRKFNLDELRTDIINNVEFKELKEKYDIKTRIEFEGLLYKLSKQDGKLYEYQIPDVSREILVYESKDGFIKIGKSKVKELKSELGVETLEFGDVVLDGNVIMIELKAA